MKRGVRALSSLLLLPALWLFSTCRAEDPVVAVEHGSLLGKLEPGAEGTAAYYAFRGIPYAAVPVGPLRFKAPRPPSPWCGVRNATVEGSVCTQVTLTGDFIGTEDCLFINVYTPRLSCPSSPLPVIVFLHSSAFTWGDGGSGWYGPDFINYKGVVLVTANYRLGPFGFLNLQTAGAPGNAGLKDTLAVLRWVNRNVGAFCGDVSRVTLGGQSAGAMMAHVHVVNPRSQGLFHRALLMSGNALTPMCHVDAPQALEAAKELGALLGARDNATASLERVLRTATGEQINSAQFTMLMREPLPNVMMKFAMSSEEEAASEADLQGSTLLTTDPESLMRIRQVKDPVPILTGTTADESATAFAVSSVSKVINGNETALMERLNSRFVEILQRMVLKVPADVGKALGVSSEFGGADQQREILKLVQQQYFNGRTTFDRTQFVSVHKDMQYVGPVVNFLLLCSGEVALYETDVLISYNLISRGLFNVTYSTSTGHSDDLGYVFRANVVDLHQDYHGSGLAPAVLRYVTTLFTDFAKGKSVGVRATCGAEWAARFLHIDGAEPHVSDGYAGSGGALMRRVFEMRRQKE